MGIAKSYYVGLTGDMGAGIATTPGQPAGAMKSKKIPLLQDTVEYSDRYRRSYDVSGVNPEDIAVVTAGNDVIIEVEKEFSPNAVAQSNWEKAYGIFTRRLRIPADVSDVEFSVFGDVLQIDLVKMAEKTAGSTKTSPATPSVEADL